MVLRRSADRFAHWKHQSVTWRFCIRLGKRLVHAVGAVRLPHRNAERRIFGPSAGQTEWSPSHTLVGVQVKAWPARKIVRVAAARSRDMTNLFECSGRTAMGARLRHLKRYWRKMCMSEAFCTCVVLRGADSNASSTTSSARAGTSRRWQAGRRLSRSPESQWWDPARPLRQRLRCRQPPCRGMSRSDEPTDHQLACRARASGSRIWPTCACRARLCLRPRPAILLESRGWDGLLALVWCGWGSLEAQGSPRW